MNYVDKSIIFIDSAQALTVHHNCRSLVPAHFNHASVVAVTLLLEFQYDILILYTVFFDNSDHFLYFLSVK